MVSPPEDTPPASEDEEPSQSAGRGKGEPAGSRAEGKLPDGEPESDARAVLLDAIEEPGGAAHRLPYVLTRLESDRQGIRLLAATACCLIAVETDDEELVEYLVRRMSDRLTEDQVSLELTTALEYLSSSFAQQVEPILLEMAEQRRELPLPRVGNFTRSYYYGSEMQRAGVGRTHIAGEDTAENPMQTVADRQREEREQIAYEQQRDEDDRSDEDDRTNAEGEETFSGSSAATVRQTTEVSSITVKSQFDELHIQGERSRGRYATTYETLVGDGSDQRAVALRLLHQPDGVLPRFDRELGEHLARWQSASDHDSIVTVFDWQVETEPWVATDLIEESLAEHDRPAPSAAVDHALRLAEGVSHLHGNDVVHGGLDSKTVVFPGERFDDEAAGDPLLNNVGLINVFRYHFDPADCLDPRYAAPEYYDDRFGRIDHATDIYQLGTVCYRLFTGRPPFTGEFETVREAVVSRTPPAPTAVVDGLPDALDEILAKTMAKQKLRRYETVEQFRGELASLTDEFT